jgi:hypothetical protein
MTDVKPSKRKPQLTTNNSELIQGVTKKLQFDPQIAVSYTINKAIKKELKMASVETKQDPEIPINLPKKKQDIKLKKGNNIIQKYID